MSESKALEVIRALAELETTIGGLYGVFARCYPEDEEFWAKLSRQEGAHARILLGLIPLIEKGSIRFNTHHFDLMAIRLAGRSIESHAESAREKSPPVEDALSLAMSIENNLLEANFFDVSHSRSPRFEKTVAVLEADTKRHREAIQRRLDVVRKRVPLGPGS